MVVSSPKKSGKGALQQEEILQAVVTADNFNDKFAPITKDHPWVLLPLLNRPLIDYTLEYLSTNGIQETFLFCCSHAEKIRDHIRNSKWALPNSRMSVNVISSETYLSVGDMIRDLDSKALIRSDFVLLDGGVVSNLPLRPILEEHRQDFSLFELPGHGIEHSDKGALMTLVYRKALPRHRSRCVDDECAVAINPDTNKLLHHHKMTFAKKCDFPLAIFQEHPRISLRHDLLDSHIAICSPHVPPIFSDNFDYQTRHDFVKGILEHEEIMGNSIYMHISSTCYAASASNLVMYDSVSKDVIQRWAYPLVPDHTIGKSTSYAYQRHCIYKPCDGLQLSRSCMLKQNTLVGAGTKIGNGTTITNSVIGKNCTIGPNVTLDSVYVWDNVVIEEGCKLTTCLLATGVVVKRNVTVSPGCILSYGVTVGPDVMLKENTLLQAEPVVDDFGDTPEEPEECDKSLVGQEGHGFLCRLDEDLDEDELGPQDIWGRQVVSSEDEDSQQEDSDDDVLSEGASPPPDDTRLFYNEVVESLQRGVEENIKCDNLILEINSSRYAYNIAMKGVIAIVSRVVLETPVLCYHGESGGILSAPEYNARVKKCLVQFRPLLKNYVKDTESMLDCLTGLEEFVSAYEQYLPSLAGILNWFYDEEVLSEDAIIHWFEKKDPSGAESHHAVRKAVAKFVKWLQEAEEESD
ncbi:unnamed protein product [Ixodes hexagonus]